MTGISGTTGPANPGAMTGIDRQRHGPLDMQSARAAVADLLGLSSDELRTQHKHTSLVDLAASKGISQDQLVDTIADGLRAAAPAGAAQGPDFMRMAERIATKQPPPRLHAGETPAPAPGLPVGTGAGGELLAVDAYL